MSFRTDGSESLRSLGEEQLEQLAQDMRQTIVSVVLRNGGHLGASLGVVELAIALHRAFDSPQEPILWDVGHQAYAHKLLTGRWGSFQELRTREGPSGFPSRSESPHDVFGTGHSSTALSAALAMAWARRGTSRWTVAVVGDGGLSAGIAFEALNNVRASEHGPLLVVLNDNHMSISQSVGALPGIFSGAGARNFFESFGFEYYGPVDGHHLGILSGLVESIKSARPARPVLLHVLTEKGRGYAPAEQNPGAFHGVSPVKRARTEKIPGHGEVQPLARTFSEEFGHQIFELAARDERIVAITAAMTEGTGLTEFARRFPERFFDVGIAEPHAVTFAAGLATQGFRPIVAIYSTFLQRAIDSIIHDVALQNLSVTFAVDRAGIVGPDGPTHHGAFDLTYLGMVPGMRILTPAIPADLVNLLETALSTDGPAAIRFPRGAGSSPGLSPAQGFIRDVVAAEYPKLIVLALGSTLPSVLQAATAADPDKTKVSVVNVLQAKPCAPGLPEYLARFPGVPILTVEAATIQGGFGQGLAAATISARDLRQWHFAGLPDRFLPHGQISELELDAGLSPEALFDRIKSALG